MALSIISGTQRIKEGMIPIPSSKVSCQQPLSVTAVSQPVKTKKVLQSKSSKCKKTSRKLKLSKTSGQDSTTIEKDLIPYWSDWHKEKSSQLWLPTKPILQGLDRSLLNILSGITVANSWFSIELNTTTENLPTIFASSLRDSLLSALDSDAILTKSKKIRLYPTKEQARIFRQWFGAARYAYNQIIAYLKQPGTKANWKNIKKALLDSFPSWSKKIPQQVRAIAIRDACKAVSKAKKDFKITGEFKEVKFRSRKKSIQSCYIPKNEFRSGGIYPRLSRGQIELVEKVPAGYGDIRLVCERERWYLCLPYKQKQDVTENQGRVVSLDPGVRTFQTFFAENSCGKLGTGDFGRIQRLCTYLDRLISKRTLEKQRFKKLHLGKAILRLRNKIRDLVDELHHKVAMFLVKSFDVIILPTFETQDMSRKGARKLRAKSVRSMLTFAHYRFKMFLKQKAFETGKLVLDQNEAWTSKTVSWTGEILPRLGGAKQVVSATTGLVMDRDYNGARGIFLRALGDQPILQSNLKNASALNITSVTFGSEK